MIFVRSIKVTTTYFVYLLLASCNIPTGWSFGPTSLINSNTNKIYRQDSFSCSSRISRISPITSRPRNFGFNFNNRLTSNNRRATTTSVTRLSYTDFYSLLGIPRNADAADIKQAYRDMAKKLHPDANKDKKGATELFQQINRAYEVLKDRDLKEKYDAYGEKGIGTSASSDKEATESHRAKTRCEPNTRWRSASYSDSWGNYAGARNSYSTGERSYSGGNSYGGDSSYYTRSPNSRSRTYSRYNGRNYGGRRSPYERDYDDRRSPYDGNDNYGRDPFDEDHSSPYSTGSNSNYGRDPFGRGRTNPYGRSNQYGGDPFGERVYASDPFEGRVYGRDPFGRRDPFGERGYSGGFSGGFSPQPSGTSSADILEDDYFSGSGSSSSSSTTSTTNGSSNNGANVSSRSRTGSIKVGDDLNAYVEIDLIDAKHGGEETITITKKVKCNDCNNGDGIEPGSSVFKCSDCNGYGFTTVKRNSRKCQKCQGTGKTWEQHCGTCNGSGVTSMEKKLNVTIPKGVQGSHTVFIEGEGDAGLHGGPPGDLYVFLRVQTDLRP